MLKMGQLNGSVQYIFEHGKKKEKKKTNKNDDFLYLQKKLRQ
jgi:hypothetical protein